MSSDLSHLERSLHRAYEIGRLKWAVVGAGVLLAVVSAGLALADRGSIFYVIALALALIGGTQIWRGGDAGNALVPGIAVSLVPMLLAAVMLDCTSECSGLCMRHCMTVCATGAAAAGVLAAILMRKHPRKHRAWLFAVALVPASGLLGCPHVGYGQLAGLVAGLLIAKAVVMIPSAARWTRT